MKSLTKLKVELLANPDARQVYDAQTSEFELALGCVASDTSLNSAAWCSKI
jgi:hypothetical protein